MRFALRRSRALTGYSLTACDVDVVVNELATTFGVGYDALRADGVDWSADPFARGSYAAFAPGQLSRFGQHLRRSWGQVHFAGAERSSLPDQLEGALESGERVAGEVVTALQGPERKAH